MKMKDIVQISNKTFVHTYSDKGLKLERDGDLYDDAFDLVELGREYTETGILIDAGDAVQN